MPTSRGTSGWPAVSCRGANSGRSHGFIRCTLSIEDRSPRRTRTDPQTCESHRLNGVRSLFLNRAHALACQAARSACPRVAIVSHILTDEAAQLSGFLARSSGFFLFAVMRPSQPDHHASATTMEHDGTAHKIQRA